MLDFLIEPIITSMTYFAAIGSFVYLVVFFVSAIESSPVGAFFPGILVMFYFGSIISQGYMNFIPCVTAAIIGASIGDNISYYIGKYGSRFFKEEHKYLSTKNLNMGERFFEKFGPKSLVIARFVGPVRPIIPIVAGMTRMSFKKFTAWNIVGAIIWSFLYLSVGVFVGNNWRVVAGYFSEAGLVAAVIVVVVAIYFIRKERKKILGV